MRCFFFFTKSAALIASLGVVGSACGGMATVVPTAGDSGTSGNDGGGSTPNDGGGGCVGTGECKCGTPLCVAGQWQCGTCTTSDAGAFCTGAAPRVRVNGAEVPVMGLSGKGLALNCCESAEVRFGTSMFQAQIAILWRMSAVAAPPAVIDLANPPAGAPPFAIELDLGCDPATTTCGAGAEDRYTTGFQGTLQFTTTASGMTASYCLSVAEAPASPHAVLHSLELYAPNVASPF